jgi:cell filamentation protein
VTRDPYADPETGVLINLLGIRDAEHLIRAETDLSTFALIKLERQPLVGNYDLNHLRDFHRAIFRDVYVWAGELRRNQRPAPVP